jgi:hypothetical protein
MSRAAAEALEPFRHYLLVPAKLHLERKRKFRTIRDAVTWLHRNRPEIAQQFDKPYTPQR